jgi:muramoyltetrapeptide carboxypeptidase
MSTDLEHEDNEPELLFSEAQFKASPLKPGAKVALIAPSGRPASPLVLSRCRQIVEEMGFTPVVGKNVMAVDGFAAGCDDERIDDLHAFLADQSIEALLCVSGGYGAARLLRLLDFDLVRQRPKILLGSGDNDALLVAVNKLTGLTCFHGPNLDEVKDRHAFESIKSALATDSQGLVINCRDEDDASFEAAAYSLSDRVCRGTTCGGNLTALASLFGTRYQPEMQDKILLLDDFDERNDILDRWFTTLYLAGSLNEVSGIAFGGFPNCSTRDSKNMLSIEDMFGLRIQQLGTPACFGFKFGLAGSSNVVPLGVRAELDCRRGSLQILEPALI